MQKPQWAQIIGLFASSFQKTAPMGQALRQKPHPVHFSFSSLAPPPSLGFKAPVGQTAVQGGSGQARQTMMVKPRSMPPIDLVMIQACDNPPLLERREQANMQLWQPTHLSVSITASLWSISPKP
jgi:hypothetical protein